MQLKIGPLVAGTHAAATRRGFNEIILNFPGGCFTPIVLPLCEMGAVEQDFRV
jgi:hypothetical protein